MINLFKEENEYLSNFHDKPVQFRGHVFRNRESAYQWSKFCLCEDREVIHKITAFYSTSGPEAKALGRELKAHLRSDWHEVSLGIMSEIVHCYFVQNKEERYKLVLTYPQELVEGNWWHDEFWGVCSCQGKKLSCGAGKGKNWLGRILMAERVYWLDLMANKYPPA